ncbi:hypothetical protein PFJ87_03g01830 [Encephalitozoon hellem]|uniref:Uncharacterized protein n=1 Tax=Encephalitozoon hellem TaxID=27973 RepID=A0ABY8CMD0_ENCHE|nr:hypothetical protein PFJ87_03g00130 [Encephalitozoon hellem]WEL38323.1 hypothetical protein PFJ87_03g01830 [Encephalitozoon hellem]
MSVSRMKDIIEEVLKTLKADVDLGRFIEGHMKEILKLWVEGQLSVSDLVRLKEELPVGGSGELRAFFEDAVNLIDHGICLIAEGVSSTRAGIRIEEWGGKGLYDVFPVLLERVNRVEARFRSFIDGSLSMQIYSGEGGEAVKGLQIKVKKGLEGFLSRIDSFRNTVCEKPYSSNVDDIFSWTVTLRSFSVERNLEKIEEARCCLEEAGKDLERIEKMIGGVEARTGEII